MKRLLFIMTQMLVCVFFVAFGASCEDPDVSVFADTGEAQSLPLTQTAPPPTYHLPFMSGERYEASTYTSPGYAHTAWDFNKSGDRGEPIVAAENGTVISISTNCPEGTQPTCGGGFGNYVKIRHTDGYQALYAHMQPDQVFVRLNQWVERGQALGRLGTSGDSTGNHLHFEVQNSAGTPTLPNLVWDGGSGQLDRSYPWSSYTSKNQGKFDSMRNQVGIGNIGNQSTTNVTRVHALGFSLTYNGGAFGENTMYYEALGCLGGAGCPTYNNTNYAWNVRGAIRATYFSMGGPNSWLGFPTGNEYAWSNGQRQNFRCGYLYWNRGTGVTTATSYGCP